jgi:hypothetical protein
MIAVTASATNLGGLRFQKRHDQMIRDPMATHAEIVDVVTQS